MFKVSVSFYIILSERRRKICITYFLTECGSVVDNVLSSPGYPNNYPNNMDCNYVVPIANGMAMKIDFSYFNVGYLSSCR